MERFQMRMQWKWPLVALLMLLNTPLALALPGDQIWSAPTFGNIGSSAAINPLNGDLYVGSANYYVYAYNSLGVSKWRFKTEGFVGSSPAVSADGSKLYVGSYDGSLYALDTSSGASVWTVPFTTAGEIYSSPAISNDGTAIYVGSSDGQVYAIDAGTGLLLWQYNVGSNVAASPAVGLDGTVYVGAESGAIYALVPEVNATNRLQWSLQLSAGGVVSAAIDTGNRLYVGTFANEFFAVDVSEQQILWSRVMGGRVASSPAIADDGTLYVTSFDDGALSAINAEDGALLWVMYTGDSIYSSPAVAADGTVYVGSFDGVLYAVTPGVGDHMVRWTFSADSELISSPTISDNGTIYFVSKSSNLYAIEDNSGGPAISTWPMFGRDSRHSHMTNDTDGDGLDDAYEVALGLNPAKWDSDEDGYNDLADLFPSDPSRAFFVAPTILSVTATPTRVLGNGSSQLRANVSYPSLGAGSLSYSWSLSSSAAGVISNSSATSPTFDAFNISYDNAYVITVNVSDGVYSSSRSVAITVEGDTDGDGMSDMFEITYGFDMNSSHDGVLNSDADSLTNAQEYSYRTNPLDPDSDGDGLYDDVEIAAGRDPLLNEAVLVVIINSILLN